MFKFSKFITQIVIISAIVYISGCSPTVTQNPTGSPSASPKPLSSPSVKPSVSLIEIPSPVVSSAPIQNDLSVGAKIDDNFYLNSGPAPILPGMKWVYSISTKFGSIINVLAMSIEILSVNGNLFAIRQTLGNQPTDIKTTNFMKPVTEDQKNIDFTYQGTEDVTVPAGSYSGAAKITGSYEVNGAKTDLVYWFVKGIGAVKYIIVKGDSTSGYSITTELMEFNNK